MAERLEEVKTLRPPLGDDKPHDSVGQDEADEGEDEQPAVLPVVV
jgi:hypothetical protein